MLFHSQFSVFFVGVVGEQEKTRDEYKRREDTYLGLRCNKPRRRNPQNPTNIYSFLHCIYKELPGLAHYSSASHLSTFLRKKSAIGSKIASLALNLHKTHKSFNRFIDAIKGRFLLLKHTRGLLEHQPRPISDLYPTLHLCAVWQLMIINDYTLIIKVGAQSNAVNRSRENK